MAKVTLLFAGLLIALGLAGYLGTGGQHATALIPTWFGVALGIFGFLAISPNESRRKLFMHINVTIGLIGFLGGAIEAIRGYVRRDGYESQRGAFTARWKRARIARGPAEAEAGFEKALASDMGAGGASQGSSARRNVPHGHQPRSWACVAIHIQAFVR